MPDTIDSLRIEIDSQATKANKSIDNLVKKLNTLSTAIKSIEKVNLTNFTQGLNQFTNSMQKMQGVKAEQFATIANGIKKISTIDSAKLNAVSVGLKNLSTGLNGFNNISYNFSSLNSLSSAINQLGYKASGKGTENLSKIKIDLVDFINGLNSVGTINFDMTGLSNLISSLNKLGGKAATQATANLRPMKEQILQFVNGLNGLGSIKFDMSGLSSLVSSLSRLGGKTVTNAVTNIPLLADKLKYLMQVLSTAPSVSQNVIQMTNALANLASQGNKVGTASKGLVSGLNRTNNAMKSSKKQALSLAAAFGKFYASYFLVIRGIKKLWSSIESSMNYIETLNYFNQAFRQVADNADVSAWKEYGYKSAEAYADSFAERSKQLTQKLTGYEISDRGDLTRTDFPSLGLDPEKTMQYQATFAQMSSSMGVASETALKLSNALTMIGADLASVRNMNFTDVWDDMTSGLVGMSRTWDKYGVNIREVNLQQKLNELGIQANISSLNQQDKAILRTIILLDSTRYAWGDLANTINAPANQLRVLQANFQSLARTIGSLFLPVITAVLPYINALIIAVQRLFSWIAGLFGINLSSFVSSVGSSAVDMGALADEADDTASGIDSAADSAEKLRKSLASYDELNVVPEKTDTSTGGGTGGGGGIGDMSALNAALDDILEEYQKAWDDAFEQMENRANEIADNIAEAFRKIRVAAIPTVASILNLRDGLSELGNFSWGTLQDFWNNFLKPIGMWMLGDQSGLYRFFDITNDILNEINWDRLRTSLADFYSALVPLTQFVWTSLMDFYEYFLKPVAVWTIGEGLPQLIDILTEFINTINWDEINLALAEFWKALAPFATSVGQGLINFFSDLMGIGADFINVVVPNGLRGIADALNMISPETAEKIGYALGVVATAFLGFKAVSGIATIITGIATSLSGLLAPLTGLFAEGAIFGSGGAVSTALLSIQGLITALTGVTVPINAIVAAIALVVGAIIDLWNTSETFREAVVRAFSDVWSSITGAVSKIVAVIGPFIESIKNLGISIYEFYDASPIKDVVALFSTLAATIVGQALSTAIDSLSTAFSGIVKVLTGAVDILSGVFQILTGLLTLDFSKISEGLESIGEGIMTALGGIAEQTAGVGIDIIEGLLRGILEAASSIKSWLKEHIVDPIVENVKNLFGIHSPSTVFAEIGENLVLGLQEGITNIWGQLIETINKFLGEIFTNVSGKWTEIKQKSEEIWGNIKTTVSGKVEQLKTDLGTWVGNIKQNWDTTWDNMKTSIGGTVSSIAKSIEDGIGEAVDYITGLPSKALGWGKDIVNSLAEGIRSIKLPKFDIDFTTKTTHILGKEIEYPWIDISWYAQGGVFNTPSVIGVGENGAEAVMPLENNTEWIDILAGKIAVSMAEMSASETEPQQNVNVVIEGEMKNFIRAIVKESRNYYKQTGMSLF